MGQHLNKKKNAPVIATVRLTGAAAGAVQGQLPGGEGHDVLFEDSGLRSRVMAFTRQWLGGADPVVEGAP